MKPPESRTNETETLDVFSRVNPSETAIEDQKVWAAYEARLHRRFTVECRLPPGWLRGVSVLDVGCGTGEKSLVMAAWGAIVTGIDFNPTALTRARSLAATAAVPHKPVFYEESLTALSSALQAKSFGLVYADGVLHHLSQPREGLLQVASLVAPGGFLVVRAYHPITSLQRFMKRFIVRIGAQGGTAAIEQNATRLFSEDLERSVAVAGRGLRQAVADNFVAPYKPISLWDIVDLCRSGGFEIYAQSPSPEAPGLLGPGIPDAAAAQPADSSPAWNAVSTARTMVASTSATNALAAHGSGLASCAGSERALEAALTDLLSRPGSDSWQELVNAVDAFVQAYEAVAATLWEQGAHQLRRFRDDLGKLSPVVDDALKRGIAVAALPASDVLFKGTSGLTMASWVLRRKDTPTPSPL